MRQGPLTSLPVQIKNVEAGQALSVAKGRPDLQAALQQLSSLDVPSVDVHVAGMPPACCMQSAGRTAEADSLMCQRAVMMQAGSSAADLQADALSAGTTAGPTGMVHDVKRGVEGLKRSQFVTCHVHTFTL